MAIISLRTTALAGALAAVLASTLHSEPIDTAPAMTDYWKTRPNTAVRVLLLQAPHPVEAVMLLPGGHGNINLDGRGNIGWGEDDFVIRTRRQYVDRGIAALIPDVAADHKPPASLAGFRTSPERADDLLALSQHLHGVAPKIWIVANDTGATSALNAVARGKTDLVAGLVLISPVLEEPQPNSTLLVDAVKLAVGRMPVLVISHQSDACSAPDVERIKQAAAAAGTTAVNFQSLTVTGASTTIPLRDPFGYAEGSCNTQAQHRLAGLDEDVTGKIIDWMHHADSTAAESATNARSSSAADAAAQNTPPLTQSTPLSAMPEPGVAGFRWAMLRGLNAGVVDADAVVAGQPVLRLIATGGTAHTLGIRRSGLAKGQVYRVAAWVKSVAGGNVGLTAFDRPDSEKPPDFGQAVFDLDGHRVLDASGVTGRDIEPRSDGWQKVWIDLPTVDGEFLVAVRPIKGREFEYDGDGKLGILLGGIEVQKLD